jgi:hypothetical protein
MRFGIAALGVQRQAQQALRVEMPARGAQDAAIQRLGGLHLAGAVAIERLREQCRQPVAHDAASRFRASAASAAICAFNASSPANFCSGRR